MPWITLTEQFVEHRETMPIGNSIWIRAVLSRIVKLPCLSSGGWKGLYYWIVVTVRLVVALGVVALLSEPSQYSCHSVANVKSLPDIMNYTAGQKKVLNTESYKELIRSSLLTSTGRTNYSCCMRAWVPCDVFERIMADGMQQLCTLISDNVPFKL